MKKILIIFSFIMIIFLPLNTFAEDGFVAANVPWYNTSSGGNALPLISNTRFRYQDYTPTTSQSWYSTTFYGRNISITSGRFDYLLIDMTIYSYDYTFDEYSPFDYVNGVYIYQQTNYLHNSFVVYLNQNNGLRSTCYVMGEINNSHAPTYNLYCPIYNNSNSITGFIVEWYTISQNPVRIGLSDWYSYHVIHSDASAITSAISTQTTNITNSIDDVNNSLTDSSGNSNTDNQNAINSFQSNLASNDTISSLVVMPITFFQSMLNSVSGTCTPFSLGTLFGTSISLPCINLEIILGSTLWGIIDVLISGFFIYNISSKFKNIFHDLTSLKDVRNEVGN